MTGFMNRNLKVFFRDKTSVFFSLLAVFIIIGLYVLFLGDVWAHDLQDLPDARTLMDSWIMAGLLAVTSMTTTMGAFGTMVDDKSKKIIKDFHASPIKKSEIAGGYIASSFVIGVIMTLVALVLAEIYILANGGALLSAFQLLQVFGLVLLSTLTNTAIVFFIVFFFKSQNAFATASTIIGTLIGFLTGIYLPIGMLPEAVQYVIKVFPVSHAALLMRQIIMEAPFAATFAGAPPQYMEEFKETMGVVFRFGSQTVTPLTSVFVLIATALVFYGLSILMISRKSK